MLHWQALSVCFCLIIAAPSWSHGLDDYVFVPDTDRWVEVFHDQTTSVGPLDAAGNFLPMEGWLNHQRGEARSVIDRKIWLPNWPDKNVYEFRSGRLIKGE